MKKIRAITQKQYESLVNKNTKLTEDLAVANRGYSASKSRIEFLDQHIKGMHDEKLRLHEQIVRMANWMMRHCK